MKFPLPDNFEVLAVTSDLSGGNVDSNNTATMSVIIYFTLESRHSDMRQLFKHYCDNAAKCMRDAELLELEDPDVQYQDVFKPVILQGSGVLSYDADKNVYCYNDTVSVTPVTLALIEEINQLGNGINHTRFPDDLHLANLLKALAHFGA